MRADDGHTRRVYEPRLSFNVPLLSGMLEDLARREIERLQRSIPKFTEDYLRTHTNLGV